MLEEFNVDSKAQCDTLQQISSWMSANLLTFNSSKTEILIIGLKQQLYKIDNSSLSTTHSARNLSFIFGEHLTFSDQISSLSIVFLVPSGLPSRILTCTKLNWCWRLFVLVSFLFLATSDVNLQCSAMW